jgi:manganese/zinc/iron transport system permease protein
MRRSWVSTVAAAAALLAAMFLPAGTGQAATPAGTSAPAPPGDGHRPHVKQTHATLADTSVSWPSWSQVQRVVLLRDYNTRLVLLGTTLFGLATGLVGSFMLLRRRSLVGDVVSHASLPGVAIAFLVLELLWPGSGKWLPGLLLGAFVAGVAGILCLALIRKYSRVKEDAAMAIVLAIFFGLGIALLTIVQRLPSGNQAGLMNFIVGKAAAIGIDDVKFIAQAAGVVMLVCLLFFKEFTLLCFDQDFAAAQGMPVLALDLLLMVLVLGVAVIGLQSVGLVLVVATLITPAASARFWTDHVGRLAVLAALGGGVSAYVGVLASALFPRLQAGAVIVLAGSAFFLFSLLLGTRRGLVRRWLLRWQVQSQIGRDDLLRACYEMLEPVAPSPAEAARQAFTFDQLLAMRSWEGRRLRGLLRGAMRERLVERRNGAYVLTARGAAEARRAARNHRLWELYLLQHADMAPAVVDRGADQIEHALDPEVLHELQAQLAEEFPDTAVPPSPHPIKVEA